MSNILSGHNHSLDTGIAETCGISAALIFNHICYWIRHNKIKSEPEKEGRTWTFQSLEDMNKYIPYLSTKQIRLGLDSLVEYGLIIKKSFNKSKFDRTMWYALKDESIVRVKVPHNDCEPFAPQGNSTSRPGQMHTPPRANDIYKEQDRELEEKKESAQSGRASFSSQSNEHNDRYQTDESEQVCSDKDPQTQHNLYYRSENENKQELKKTKQNEIDPLNEKAAELAELLFATLKEINPKILRPTNFPKWDIEMKHLLKTDKREEADVRQIIAYIKESHSKPSNNDFTWFNAVQSPLKLRKHFASIWGEMTRPNTKKYAAKQAEKKFDQAHINREWAKANVQDCDIIYKSDTHVSLKMGKGWAPLSYSDNAFQEQVTNFLRKGGML